MRSLAVIALAFILSLLPASATPAPQESAQPPAELGSDTLVMHFKTEPPTLNPITSRDIYGSYILAYTSASLYVADKEYMRNLASGKVKSRPEGPMKPELAAGYPEISEDKLTWTIRLKEGCRWHNGEEITANDIKASFDLMMNEKVDAARLRPYYELVDEVIVEDDYAITFKFKEKYYFAQYSLPDIPLVPESVIEELDDPADWNKIDQVVGSGPYKLEEWNKGNEIVLLRNDDFWGDKPQIKRIRFKIIKEDPAAIASLRRGEIDLMAIPPSNWEREIKDDEEIMSQYQHLQYYRPGYGYIGWNQDKPLFGNKKVRKALTMCLDIQGIIKSISYGYAKQITGPAFFLGEQYNRNVKPLPFDPEGAKVLLQEAGWVDTDRDGLLDKDGEKFEFELMITTGNPNSDAIALMLRNTCAKIGIGVEIRRLEWGAFLEKLNQDYEACMLGWGLGLYEGDMKQIWHSDSIMERGSNRVRFRIERADTLIMKARVEFDREKRNAMYHELHEIIYDEQPYTFMTNGQTNLLVHKRFKGKLVFPGGIHPRAGEELWVPKGQEKYK